jgi:hypothetical protein
MATEMYTATNTVRQAFPVARADTSLSAAFAWVAQPVSSSPIADPDVYTAEPVPDIQPILRSFQSVLDRLPPQTDEGDLAGLGDEVVSWSEARARATRLLIDD